MLHRELHGHEHQSPAPMPMPPANHPSGYAPFHRSGFPPYPPPHPGAHYPYPPPHHDGHPHGAFTHSLAPTNLPWGRPLPLLPPIKNHFGGGAPPNSRLNDSDSPLSPSKSDSEFKTTRFTPNNGTHPPSTPFPNSSNSYDSYNSYPYHHSPHPTYYSLSISLCHFIQIVLSKSFYPNPCTVYLVLNPAVLCIL